MAGGQEKALRRRIRTVQSTKKITRAMELIAASRIVRAQQRVAAARPYSELLTQALRNIAAAGDSSIAHPLLANREDVKRVGFVVITADRGLAGGYNAGVIRAAERALQAEQARGRDYALILCGKKAEAYFRFKRYRIDASFTGFSEAPTYEDARKVAAIVMDQFNEEAVDEVQLAYTQVLSVASQRVLVRRFLPLQTEALTEGVGEEDGGGAMAGYEFEPAPEGILARLLPRYVEARLFDAMLEAAASEHAARQRAMKSATDNATELIKALERIANRARQESITTEIMEIVGGAEALSQAGHDATRVDIGALSIPPGDTENLL
jgi:F-type H+-transporting ATPase subunit gamma